MKPKYKSLFFNFIGFAVFFLIARFTVGYFLVVGELFLGVMAFIIATVLAPKFAAIQTNTGEKIVVKWIFVKGLREL